MNRAKSSDFRVKSIRSHASNGEKCLIPLKSVLLLLYCSIALIFLSMANAHATDIVGRFSAVEGKVDILRKDRFPAIIAEPGIAVSAKDIIRTKSKSKAEIIFNDGNILRIAEKGRINIDEYISGRSSIFSLSIGKVEAVVRKQMARRIAVSGGANRFEIRTPTAVAGVRGTDYFASYNGNITEVFVKEGVVAVYNIELPDVVVIVTAGNMAVIEQDKAPQPPGPAVPEDMQNHEKDVTPEKGEPSSAQPQDELEKFTGCKEC